MSSEDLKVVNSEAKDTDGRVACYPKTMISNIVPMTCSKTDVLLQVQTTMSPYHSAFPAEMITRKTEPAPVPGLNESGMKVMSSISAAESWHSPGQLVLNGSLAPGNHVLSAKPAPVIKITPNITENWTLVDIATKATPTGWEKLFQFALPELAKIDERLAEDAKAGKVVFPAKKDIFQAFMLTPPSNVKVIIFGQDPYPGRHVDGMRPQATGLSFSIASDDKMPASMRNIAKEVESNYPEYKAKGPGNLYMWAMQGVLLLNTALTVEEGKAESHLKNERWSGFIKKTLRFLAENCSGAIYVMWGAKAKKLAGDLDPRGEQLTAGHPSPNNLHGGFIGCGHFKAINESLKKKGRQTINWTIY